MPQRSRNSLASWVIRGWKPLVSQVIDWMDSFWHKEDSIPVSSIDGLEGLLNSLPTQQSVDNILELISPEEIEFVADGTYTLPAGRALTGVVVLASEAMTINVGSTPGGYDIVADEEVLVGEPGCIATFIYTTADKTIHISGITAAATIKFYKQ